MTDSELKAIATKIQTKTGKIGCLVCGSGPVVADDSFPIPMKTSKIVTISCLKCGHIDFFVKETLLA